MKWEMTGASLTNLECVETISASDVKGRKGKDAHLFEIHFELNSGKTVKTCYKDQLRRDRKFNELIRVLTK